MIQAILYHYQREATNFYILNFVTQSIADLVLALSLPLTLITVPTEILSFLLSPLFFGISNYLFTAAEITSDYKLVHWSELEPEEYIPPDQQGQLN